jgi:hypothetical protein
MDGPLGPRGALLVSVPADDPCVIGVGALTTGSPAGVLRFIEAVGDDLHLRDALRQQGHDVDPPVAELLGGWHAFAKRELLRRVRGLPPTRAHADPPNWSTGVTRGGHIRHRVDLTDFVRKHAGYDPSDFLEIDGVVACRCPFPGDRRTEPLFFIGPGRQRWLCIGCDRAGDVLDFAYHRLGIQGRALMAFMSAEAGLPPPSDEEWL